MKKTLADKMAEKAFENPNVQKSWQTHLQAFGPILENVFQEDIKSRIHLINALNHLSRQELKKAYKLMQDLEKVCSTDYDKTAWYFFMALIFEMANDKDNAISLYTKANDYGHHFYMSYLRLAKILHQLEDFETAESNYRKTITCLEQMGWSQQTQVIAASIYTNLASCLTMLYKYEEAEEALAMSHRWLAQQAGREATEAILYAAQRKEEAVLERLEMLKGNPNMYEATKKLTDAILAGEHEHLKN